MDKLLIKKFSVISDVLHSKHKAELLNNITVDVSANVLIFSQHFKSFTDELDTAFDKNYNDTDELTKKELLTIYKFQIASFKNIFKDGFF